MSAPVWKLQGQRKGYTIDGGIHFLMCPKPGQSIYELYRELGTAQSNRFLDMTSYCRFIDETSGRSVDITPDLDILAKELKAISPADSRIIDDLIAGARIVHKLAIATPPWPHRARSQRRNGPSMLLPKSST